MAEPSDEDMVPEATPGYKPPAEKSLDSMLNQDQEDESLVKYKQQLLGTLAADKIEIRPEDPRHVIVTKLALVVEGRPDKELNLEGDLKDLKKQVFVIKEETKYRIKVYFYVQREIVTGLKYLQNSYRKGIRVEKTSHMVGSYGPKLETHSYMTPMEEAPSGMLFRGSYDIKSCFTDDDNNVYLSWEWTIKIAKEWDN